ncbi:hypothetical protein C0993_008236 [Termitomyces sp. T159_Od127]|nr:hypothetical protein C0993_008236 [Termitomyces sp. T159_Od127]
MSEFALCDDRVSLRKAMSALSGSTILAFDCEGKKLGTVGGKLSFITLRSINPRASSPEAYLVDAVKLGQESLRPIFDLLENELILKVVFDGRMDSSCLLHDYGVRLQNVVDLQLADVKSRVHESLQRRIARFPRWISPWDVYQNPGRYEKIYKLSGLEQCAEEHSLIQKVFSKRQFDHSLWLERPAKEANLKYAARDVKLISMIFDKFVSAGYIYPNIKEDSLRYVMIWSDAQPRAGDCARSNPFLPLNIIDYNPEARETDKCSGCSRILPESCFSKHGWKDPRVRRCNVCHVVIGNIPMSKGIGAGSYSNTYALSLF